MGASRIRDAPIWRNSRDSRLLCIKIAPPCLTISSTRSRSCTSYFSCPGDRSRLRSHLGSFNGAGLRKHNRMHIDSAGCLHGWPALGAGSWGSGPTARRTRSGCTVCWKSHRDSAAVVPLVFRAVDTFYWAMAPSVSSIPGGAGFIRFGASFIILLTPTFFMGAHSPCSPAFSRTTSRKSNARLVFLYALNTFGAAAGSLLAALVFIPPWHLRTTLIIASVNVAIGLFAIWLSGRSRGAESAAEQPEMLIEEPRPANPVTG